MYGVQGNLGIDRETGTSRCPALLPRRLPCGDCTGGHAGHAPSQFPAQIRLPLRLASNRGHFLVWRDWSGVVRSRSFVRWGESYGKESPPYARLPVGAVPNFFHHIQLLIQLV